MKVVRAGFCHQTHRARGSDAVLDGRGASLDFELLHRIWKWHGQIGVFERIVVIGPIQHVIQPNRRSTRDGNTSVCKERITATVILKSRCRCSGKRNQLIDVAAIQRELQNARILHDLTDSCIPRFHQRSICLDFNLLRDLTYFQDHIDRGTAVDLQHNSALCIRTESRQRPF